MSPRLWVVNQIKWCKSKSNGLELIEENDNLSKAYLFKSEDSLKSMRENVSRDWKISMAYYSIYYSVYAILMKIGIKCEIHKCTFEFIKEFLKDYFDEMDTKFIEDAFKARNDTQHYVDRSVSKIQYNALLDKTPGFIIKSKFIIEKLTEKEIKKIRSNFNNYLLFC